jgi:hypothetical protein
MGRRRVTIQHPLYSLVKTFILTPMVYWEITAHHGDFAGDLPEDFPPAGIAQSGIDEADDTFCIGCFKTPGTYGRGADPDATGAIGRLRVVGNHIAVELNGDDLIDIVTGNCHEGYVHIMINKRIALKI